VKVTIKLVPPCHESLPLSKAAGVGGVGGWRFMEKSFSGREFVAGTDARRCSGFARSVTADRGIAARPADRNLDAGSIAPPIGATSRVRRAGSIIGTGNVRTGNVVLRPA
jgi:hypothetical protein